MDKIDKKYMYIRTKVLTFDDAPMGLSNGDAFLKSDLESAFAKIPKEVMDKLFIPKESVTFNGAMISHENDNADVNRILGVVTDTYVGEDGIEVLMAFDKTKMNDAQKEFDAKWEASMSCSINPSSGEVSNIGLGIFPKNR
jgi:hypothetical protein